MIFKTNGLIVPQDEKTQKNLDIKIVGVSEPQENGTVILVQKNDTNLVVSRLTGSGEL